MVEQRDRIRRMMAQAASIVALATLLSFLVACAPELPKAPEAPKAPVVAPTPVEQPRYGGELTFVASAEPPSYDAHRETTFAAIHPTAPHYSLLLRFDPEDYRKIIGDVAESWSISADSLIYTLKLREGVKFHDGSLLTSRDVKATYDRIIFPPPGVASARKVAYAPVERVEAPDDRTVIFRLKHPYAAMLALLASPWNYLYKAEILERDPRWYEKNIMGTGPFKFVEHVPGSHWVGKKNEDYFVKGRPYLDGFRAIFIRELAAQVAAIRGGRALVEFRGFPPSARDDLVRAMGKEIVVQESPWICALYVAMNTERKPFDDVRVRRALTLALDRWEASKALSQVAFVKEVGGLILPGSPFAMPESDLVKLAGFGKDITAARAEARRLLREAGVPEGFAFTLLNRDIQMPYEAMGIFLIDQWRKVGLEVTQVIRESGPYLSDFRGGAYEVGVDWNCDFLNEPNLQLIKFISADKSPLNYGRFKDATLDSLYERQSREPNPEARKRLVWEFERRLMDEMAYAFPTLWWQRIIPHSARFKGWKITPEHYTNQDLTHVWLAPP